GWARRSSPIGESCRTWAAPSLAVQSRRPATAIRTLRVVLLMVVSLLGSCGFVRVVVRAIQPGAACKEHVVCRKPGGSKRQAVEANSMPKARTVLRCRCSGASSRLPYVRRRTVTYAYDVA